MDVAESTAAKNPIVIKFFSIPSPKKAEPIWMV
jgi:hypothetical protein